jgi:hypothetical protein
MTIPFLKHKHIHAMWHNSIVAVLTTRINALRPLSPKMCQQYILKEKFASLDAAALKSLLSGKFSDFGYQRYWKSTWFIAVA